MKEKKARHSRIGLGPNRRHDNLNVGIIIPDFRTSSSCTCTVKSALFLTAVKSLLSRRGTPLRYLYKKGAAGAAFIARDWRRCFQRE